MTRLRPRIFFSKSSRDKIIGILGEVDKKFADREQPNIEKIKELENHMDMEIFDGKQNLGIGNQKNLGKKMNKTFKGLRK